MPVFFYIQIEFPEEDSVPPELPKIDKEWLAYYGYGYP